jgi:hypothetical protein
MSASVRIRQGDIFDDPSDLIVLPCSTAGTVSGPVAGSMVTFSIPHPKDHMALGEVDIRPYEGGKHSAKFIAFAASVERFTSTIDAIEKIGKELGQFTQDHPSVKKVAVPLLGAGAGSLLPEMAIEYLRKGFAESAAADSILVICVLDKELFDRVRSLNSTN